MILKLWLEQDHAIITITVATTLTVIVAPEVAAAAVVVVVGILRHKTRR
jgi:hypothetical protein